MKIKNRKKYLLAKQQMWEKLPEREKAATTKPGSIKTK
jgi:hypothetical protein